jgi:hypothetical protein
MASKDTSMDDLAESIASLSTMVANEFTKVRQEFASVRQEFVMVHQEFHGVKTRLTSLEAGQRETNARLGYLENEALALRNDVKELYALVR